MNYTTELLWYASWPVVIYLAYKFVLLNINHHQKMEKLEDIEAS